MVVACCPALRSGEPASRCSTTRSAAAANEFRGRRGRRRQIVAMIPLLLMVAFLLSASPVDSFGVERILPAARSLFLAAESSRQRQPRRVSVLFASTSTRRSGSSSSDNDVRFLGRGPRAIVREGAVLVAPQHEYHHYYRQAAIFVYDMGYEDDHLEQEGVYVIRGVILDHPTPFTLQEMIPAKFVQQPPGDNNDNNSNNPLGESLLFRGGDKGADGVVLLHNRPELGVAEIGASGVFQGGWDAALAAVAANEADADDFKAFFNYCEFTEAELEELLESEEDGDGWASVEVGNDIVLSDQWDRGDCWKRLRNAVSQQMKA